VRFVALFRQTAVDFFTVYRDGSGGVDADAHLVAVYGKNGHYDVVADAQCLSDSAREDEHVRILCDEGLSMR
jgi:hypothetical protein